MASENKVMDLLSNIIKVKPFGPEPVVKQTNAGGVEMPRYGVSKKEPKKVKMLEVIHPDGRMSQYPPPETWDNWVEWDGKLWPKKVARQYTLVPTLCFNCEAGCGLLGGHRVVAVPDDVLAVAVSIAGQEPAQRLR